MNIENRTIFEADNLDILRGLDSETIDLIYLDPPFNSNRTYEAPIGSQAAGAAFKDAWTLSDLDNAWHGELAEEQPALYSAISAAGETHGKSMKAYLIMMGIRMLEMHRILKSTGSIYLHCDPTASHYLKTMMDSIFGEKRFRNEIVWQRTNAHNLQAKYFSKTYDVLLFYSKDKDYTWNKQYTDYSQAQLSRYKKDETGRLYTGRDLTVSSGGNRNFQWRGSRPSSNRSWGASLEQLERWYKEGRILLKKDGTPRLDGLKVYLDELPGKQIPAIWTDILRIGNTSKERLGYPTQKPLVLLNRIIKASSNAGDIVLDPFCGCATTCIAAESLQRQWIGIDISPKAIELLKLRLERDLNLTEDTGILGQVIHRTTPPTRTDPIEPRQIHFDTLFGVKDKSMLETLSQRELRRFKTHKHVLFGMQEGKCAGCQVSFHFRNMTIDHIKPRSEGGTDHPTNLQLLCGACNSTKGNRTQSYLIDKLRTDGILR